MPGYQMAQTKWFLAVGQNPPSYKCSPPQEGALSPHRHHLVVSTPPAPTQALVGRGVLFKPLHVASNIIVASHRVIF